MQENLKNRGGRSLYLDVVKACAIFLVLLGHCIQYGTGSCFGANELLEYPVFKVIYSFHMPLFMLVSGYLFAFSAGKDTWINVIIKKFKALIIPIMIWSIIPYIIVMHDWILEGNPISPWIIVKKYMGATLRNLWFLWAVFICSAIVCVVRRFFKDSIYAYLVILLLTFFVPDTVDLHLYCFMYPYFVLGYLYNRDSLDKKLRRFYSGYAGPVLGLAVYFILMMFYDIDTYIYSTGYTIVGKDIVRQLLIDSHRFAVGLSGSILVLIFIYRIYDRLPTVVLNALSFIGKNTLGIYIISGYIFVYILPVITKNITSLNYLIVLAEFVIILLASLGLTMVIKRFNVTGKLLLGLNNRR